MNGNRRVGITHGRSIDTPSKAVPNMTEEDIAKRLLCFSQGKKYEFCRLAKTPIYNHKSLIGRKYSTIRERIEDKKMMSSQ